MMPAEEHLNTIPLCVENFINFNFQIPFPLVLKEIVCTEQNRHVKFVLLVHNVVLSAHIVLTNQCAICLYRATRIGVC